MATKAVSPVPQCALDYAFHRVGGKHKGRIIWHLQHGAVRYGQLRRLLRGVSSKMLSQVLRELETDALLERHEFLEVPPRVEYTLTRSGQQLLPFITLLRAWGQQQMVAAGLPQVPDKLAAR